MIRRVLTIAATGSLTMIGSVHAGDEAVNLGRYAAPSTGGFGGGVAATAPTPTDAKADTQQIHWRRNTTYVGYPVYTYPAYYYGGYAAPAYYSPFTYGYYPSFGYPSYSYYSAPYFSPFYAAPYYPAAYSYGYSSYYYGGFWPIGGANVSAPTVSLAGVARTANSTPSSMPVYAPIPATIPASDSFRYDGGPSNPVPQPTQDVNPIPPAANGSNEPAVLRISLPSPKPKYPAYGER